ncbi:phage tail tape measure protein [Nocardiopsis dassonvillei]|uniref:phage tail tape measure protein n=1 Tax=Nocardiopsis dassonvillei TaxID=2014 RepID=UPI00363C2B90
MQRAEKAMEGYRRSIEDTERAMAQLEMELQRDAERVLREVEDRAAARAAAWEQAGQVMATAGATAALGLGLAAAAAIEWESAWTGVEKVLQATPEQVALLEQQFRELAKVLPASHTEIAEVAAAAAQLGVASEHLVGFTNTALALGVATNISSQDAAMGLARLSTIMGVSFGDIDQMGSSLVELGNNFAATEDEILQMSLRLAGVGTQVGLSSGEVMGLATGFAAVGIQAELGGGAFSRALGRMQAAVLEGGRRLENFATIAGVSADEFSDAFLNRPQDAIVMFLRGLNDLNESGGSVYSTLQQLGLGGTEIADVMGRASAAWQTVADAMETGNTGFEEGNALLEEAVARYSTTESQVKMARNALNDLAIDIGNNLLPMLGEAASGFTSWMTLFQSMPDSAQGAITAVGGTAAAAALAAGAFLMGVPRVAEFRGALDQMGPRTQAVGRGLSSVASFLGGPWGVALAVGTIALGVWADKKAEAAQRTQDFANALRMDTGELGANTQQVLANIIAKDDLLALGEQFGLNTETIVQAMLGEEEAIRAVEAALEDESTAYVRAADGGTTAANERARAARDLQEAIFGTNEQLDEARAQHEAESEVMAVATEGTQGLAAATDGLTGSQALLGEQIAGSAGEVRDLKAALDELTQSSVDATTAEIGFLDAVERASDAIATNGTGLDLNTESGRRNMEALLGLRDRSNEYTSSVWQNTGSVESTIETHERGREEFLRMAERMGATAEEAKDLADEYLGIPDEIKTEIEVSAEGRWWMRGGDPGVAPAGSQSAFYASGGAVSGPGTETSDSIPAWLSTGEHVLTAAEVRALGGQDQVYAMRSLIRQGALKFARGGAVGALPRSAQIIHDHREDVRINIQRLIAGSIAGVAKEAGEQWRRYLSSGGAVVSAWRSQVGVPYSWGGGGPGGPSVGFGRGAGTVGFDCSSLMQFGWAKAGVHLPRTTYQQIGYGQSVRSGAERPGDLVFPHRGHVAGVVRPGLLIHAPYTGATVSYRGMYSSPIAIRRPGRYDRGGLWPTGTYGENVSGRPERVLDPRQTAAFERLVDGALSARALAVSAPGAGAGGGETHFHIHHVPGYSTIQDLQHAEERRQQAARTGRRR